MVPPQGTINSTKVLMKKSFLLILLILFFRFSFPEILCARGFDYKEIYKLRSPAVVLVLGLRKNGVGSSGTGSIIKKNGLVITNAHVIIDESTNRVYPHLYIYIKPDNFKGDRTIDLKYRFKANAIKYSTELDLALLKIVSSPHNLSTIPFADPNSVEIGDPVLAIGHPEQGGLWTLTTGVISTRIKNFENIKGKDVFQTETSFNKGNSGGPLINLQGNMVGINSNIARKGKNGIAITDINFSISSGVVKKWLDRVGYRVAYLGPLIQQGSEKDKGDDNFEHYPAIQQNSERKLVKKQPLEKKKRLWAKGTQLTPKRPYLSQDLLKIEEEMENMMEEMRKKFK